MKIGKPISITGSQLVSSTVAEPSAGETAWSNLAAYKLGAEVINTTSHRKYENLAGAEATVTFDLTGDLVNWATHGLIAGQQVSFATSGALPTGLTAGVLYFVLSTSLTVNAFKLSATAGGSAIDLTGTQSGIHTGYSHLNIGFDPAADDGSRWLDIGPTNKYAALDMDRNVGCVGASPVTMVFNPGQRVDFVGLIGMQADQVTVTVKLAGVTKRTIVRKLLARRTRGWRDYFFGPPRYAKDVAFVDLPAYSGATIEITWVRAAGSVNTGRILLGRAIDIGKLQFNPRRQAVNYSTFTKVGDVVKIDRQPSRPLNAFTVLAEKSATQTILDLQADLSGQLALWIGLNSETDAYAPAVLIFGKTNNLTMDLTHPTHLVVSVEVEGM